MNQNELDKVRSWPLHHSWGVQSIRALDGRSEISVQVNESMSNPAGTMHGGLIYALTDVAAYTALLSVVEENQSGVTHHINVQVLRPVQLGAVLRIEAEVIKRGRRLSFIESKAYIEDKVVALASITKSMVTLS